MDISDHIQHTQAALGIPAEDLHKWIDGYFDGESFREFIESKHSNSTFNPYDHRRHRHCREALAEAQSEFEGLYSADTIEKVFYMHLQDDYDGYIPSRSDFDDPSFIHKYHAGELHAGDQDEEEILGTDDLEKYFTEKSYRGFTGSSSGDSRFWLRIVLPTVMTMSLFIYLIFGVIVPQIREVMINDKKEMIQELAKAGVSVIEYYIDQADSGVLPLHEAKEKAKRELEKMRYGIQYKDYYWIIDFHPRMLMHPYRQELVGKDLSQYRDHEDKSGKFLFREAVDIVRQKGEGYLEYYWQWMDDPDSSALKMSYVLEIPRWSWILGTGVYINDIEEDMNSISAKLIGISTLILSILSLFMLFVLFQSRRIENKRQKAEAGLKEAKIRYRSLVESANEGYILVIENSITYANKKILQILDCTENDLREKDIRNLLEDPHGNKFTNIEEVYEQCRNNPNNFWLDARLKTVAGTPQDIQLRISKIFMHETNALLITVRTLHQFQHSMLIDSSQDTDRSFQNIISDINSSSSKGHCLFSLEKLPSVIFSENIHDTAWKRRAISDAYAAVCQRLTQLSVEELRPKYPKVTENVRFEFIHLGSNARGEMTFFSDQDNAFVYQDFGSDSLSSENKRYCLELTGKICSGLKKAGFDYCPGGIQASNPAWCLSLAEWYDKIDSWLSEYSRKNILDIHVFTDMNINRNNSSLQRKIKDYLFTGLAKNKNFVQAFANSTLQMQPHKGMFGKPGSANIDGESKMDLKEYLKVIEAVLRLYSIANGIQESSTLGRLTELQERGIFHSRDAEKTRDAFEFLWQLRFSRQTESYKNLVKVDDTIPVALLNPGEKARLKEAGEILNVLLSKGNYDFQGGYL